jgi:hypothetical protein
MRGKKRADGTIIPNTKVIDTVRNIGQSNPRRFVHALITKQHAYHTFGNEAIDQAVRDADPAEVLKTIEEGKRITPENIALFENIINSNYQWLRNVIKDKDMLDKTISRLMMSLGFSKYKENIKADGSIERIGGLLSEKSEEAG